jgi:hypothetical protein
MPVYNADEIPSKVLKNFQKYVKLEPDEQLHKLYDKTIMGSGKEGVAVTDKRLLVYDKDDQESHHYHDLTHARYIRVDSAHYQLIMLAREGQIEALDIYVLDDTHPQQIVDLMRLQVDEEFWKQHESEAVAASVSGPIAVIDESSILPICPHCDTELPKVQQRDLTGMLGRRYIYFCPYCRKVLGFSHRQGYLLGR